MQLTGNGNGLKYNPSSVTSGGRDGGNGLKEHKIRIANITASVSGFGHHVIGPSM